MKKSLIGFFAVLCFLTFSQSLVFATENSWTIMTPVPMQTYSSTAGATLLGDKIYFLGHNINGLYDPATNKWTTMTPVPVDSVITTVVACRNRIYLICGNATIPTQVYDPATDTWENKTAIPTSRDLLQACVVDDKIYLIGGRKLESYLYQTLASDATDVYDPSTDSWSSMAVVPTAVAGYASAVLDNKIYIIGGGVTAGGAQNASTLVQIFDPATNQWTNGASLPVGVFDARACSTSGVLAPKRIYVVGGMLTYNIRSQPIGTNMTQVYDPETDSWTVGASMPTVRWGLGIAVVDDEIYAIGGYNGYGLRFGLVIANEKYTPIGYIPEFSSWMITPLLLATIVLVVYAKKRITT
ncbi:MAG: kelch repeat-containing protein [Candidatus Bathyarchaeia archaeon]|jgi:hypothetical protein